MSRVDGEKPAILVAGMGPFPSEKRVQLHLPGIRTWEIARELARRGHPVHLLGFYVAGDTIDIYDHFELGPDLVSVSRDSGRAYTDEMILALLERLISELKVRAVVGVMGAVNIHLARMKSEIPVWMDYPGDPMAERQLLSVQWGTDARISEQWAEQAQALGRADRLSACSRHQVGATLGQLGALGRLNRHTAFEPIVHHVPLGPGEFPEPEVGPVLRGVEVPQDALIVFQMGGFNNWLDEATLFAALETAMEREPRLHFAATGGGLGVHGDSVFESFRARVGASAHRARFHLLGWVPLARALAAMREADAGVVCDQPCMEGWLGDRYRIIHFADAGVPIVCTVGCENAEMLAAEGLAVTAPHRDPAALADAILAVCTNPAAARERAARARVWIRTRLETSRRLAPITQWCADPVPAADRAAWRAGVEAPSPLHSLQVTVGGATARIDELNRAIAQLERDLAGLRGSRIVSAAMRIREWISGSDDGKSKR